MLESDIQTKHLNFRIAGRVQGVFFRPSAKRLAEELGLAGFARNEPDGTLTVEAEGDQEALDTFAEWIKHGPELAVVESLEVVEGPLENYIGFEIVG